jgi:hypothetical protein
MPKVNKKRQARPPSKARDTDLSTVVPPAPKPTTTTSLEPLLQQIQEQLVSEPMQVVAGLATPTVANLLRTTQDPEVSEVCHILCHGTFMGHLCFINVFMRMIASGWRGLSERGHAA